MSLENLPLDIYQFMAELTYSSTSPALGACSLSNRCISCGGKYRHAWFSHGMPSSRQQPANKYISEVGISVREHNGCQSLMQLYM